MAERITIEAQPRDKVGKGASRAVRRAGNIPAVIYGGKENPVSIQIPSNVIKSLINKGGFMSHMYTVKVGNTETRAVPRDLQLDPVLDEVIHIDFLRLAKGAKVVMSVPVHLTGEKDSPGLSRGGTVNMVRHEIELEVPADAIPEFIEVSVASLDMNDSIKISDVNLPENCVPTITDRDFAICAVVAPSGLKSAESEKAEDEADTEAKTASDTEGADSGES